MKAVFVTLGLLTALAAAQPPPLPRLQVSGNHRFLVTADEKPFFYLADTAWELFHRLNREEAVEYLSLRAAQGFNVIQAVALAELDGPTDPDAHGDLPLIAQDPTKPNPKYWDHVQYIVDAANARGLYVALLPSWGRWVKDEPILTAASAAAYGEFLGRRFRTKGIIWILGGDRTAAGYEPVWRALARGIAIGVSGREDYDTVLMSFHPRTDTPSTPTCGSEPTGTFSREPVATPTATTRYGRCTRRAGSRSTVR